MIHDLITNNGYRGLVLSGTRPQEFEECYTMKAGGVIPEGYTGSFMGRIQFKDGIAKVKKHCDVRLCLMRGCVDITSKEDYQKLWARSLKKILIIRDAAFGDCVMITPLLRALREKYPDAQIDVYGREDSRIIYENLPFINNIVQPGRLTEVFAIVEDYDEVYDLVQTIEQNPIADRINSLDYLEQLFGLTIKDKRPIYFPRREEIDGAQKLLQELQLDVQGDKLVVFQPHATAHVRRIPYKDALVVANSVAESGFKVLMVGHEVEYYYHRLFECNKCKQLSSGDSRGTLKCSCESTEITVIENHPNVYDLRLIQSKYPPRQVFAISLFARMIISSDSFWGHLAAAVDRPCIMVFTNYHTRTRVTHYPRCSVVTCDYDKVAPCGPCNSLCDRCPLMPNSPACVVNVTPKMILDEFYKRVFNGNYLYQKMRDETFNTFDVERSCPFCNHNEYREVTTKGDVVYLECTQCKSFYTNKKTSYKRYIPSIIKGNKMYRPSRNLDINQILSGCYSIFNAHKLKVETTVTDLIDITDDFVKREVTSLPFVVTSKETSNDPIDSNITLWIDGIVEKDNPIEELVRIRDRMRDDSYLCLAIPLSDMWEINRKNNSWAPISSVVAGMNQSIPSKQFFDKNFNEYDGNMKDKFVMLGSGIGDKISIVVLRKVNGNKEKPTGIQGGLLSKEIDLRDSK